MKKIILFSILMALSIPTIYAQCEASTESSFTPLAADNSGTSAPFIFLFNNQYTTLSGLLIGDSYTIRVTTIPTGFLTLRKTSDNTVVTSGVGSVTFVATENSVAVHLFDSNACNPAGSISTAVEAQNNSALTTTWTGNTDTDWATAGNWDNGVPTNSLDAEIPNVTNKPIIGASTNAVAKDITIDASSSLTISSGGSLTSSGSLTQNGTLTVESGASLIVPGSSSGDFTYNRSLGTTNWYLIGSPVGGETIQDMISNNSFATGNGSNIGLAPYDNSQASADDRWDYQTSGSSGSLLPGGGYSVKLASSGTLVFTGSMPTSSLGISITDGSGSGGNSFNLVGNPYPSFIAANSNANGTDNLLSTNSSDLTETTLWFWNQATNSYDQINQASSAFHIAPTQGFFVSASGSNTFNFTENMQSHQSTDSFQRNATSDNRPQVTLKLSDGTNERNAHIYYIEGTSTGFDNGYDSSIFGGVTATFAIYTQAVENSTGRKLGIQSLPNSDYNNMIIPIGIIAQTGTEITISAESLNLPQGIHVYLEDRHNNSFTQLDTQNAVYTTTHDNASSGIGQFYLHTSSSTLSSESIDINDKISVYSNVSNNLRIVGIHHGLAKLTLYNILGKKVLSKEFMGNGINDISTEGIAAGVHIVRIQTPQGTINKKLIIKN